MSERWKNYFEDSGAFNPRWLSTAVSHWGFHEILYGTIMKYCPAPASLLNVGCGPGWSDCYLASLGYAVTGIDNEPSLVSLAQSQAEKLGAAAKFEFGDAFDLKAHYGKFDLAFSCGVLEHFDRHVTVELLREQAKCARQVIIQIPSKYTSQAAPITDERIYTISELAKIVEDAGLRVVSQFGYGDLCATTGQLWLRRLLPRAAYRFMQNRGFAYSLAVIGESRTWTPDPAKQAA